MVSILQWFVFLRPAHLSGNWAALQPRENSAAAAAAAVLSGPSGWDRAAGGACLRRRLRLLTVC